MKLVKKEHSSSTYLIEHFDDLWVLSKYISKGDVILSKTTRKVAIGDDKTKQVTKIIFIKLSVLKVELLLEEMRILGTIENETEFTNKGAHHSLTFSIGDTIEIDDSNSKYQKSQSIQSLFTSVLNSTQHKFLILLCDVDSLIISRCSLFSIEVLLEKSRLGEKKFFSTHKQTTTLDEMYELVKDIPFAQYSFVVFAGPGNYKSNLEQKIKHHIQNLPPSHSINISQVQVNAISKIVQELKEKGVISQIEELQGDSKVEKFLQLLSKNRELVAYGLDEVLHSITLGISREIIITSSYYNEFVEEYLSQVQLFENMGGKISIVNSNSHSGSILQGLGSIVSILR